ncbi:MAG: hypothetical protein SFY67_10670 [Candidatus Melainabacteria bacterium]|nr:hypothetical protein [Candidatus Melainabacteria bacterium]
MNSKSNSNLKLFIPVLIAISSLGLQLQKEVFAQGQSEKKIFYELRDALRNKLDNNQAPVAPNQNPLSQTPVQQPLSQPIAQPQANGLKDRAKQEIEVMIDKKLGTNLSQQTNAQNVPLDTNVAPVSNPNGIVPGMNQQTTPAPAGQPAQNGFNFSNLGAELKDLKVPEKYKQDYYRYRNQVKNLVK